MFFRFLRLLLIPFEKLLSLIFRPFFGNFAAPYKALKPKEIKLNAAIFSDIHIDGRKERIRKLHNGLKDCERAATPNDVFVSLGDTTDRGLEKNWVHFSEIFGNHHPAKNTFIVLGNHDRWGEYDKSKAPLNPYELYYKYSGIASDKKISLPYFSREYNGFTFITLAIDENDTDIVSDTQIQWFEEKMKTACVDGKPVFVFMHESLNISHGLPYTWNMIWKDNELPDPYRSGIGVSSDKIEAIMKKYKNVFFFSGHIHLGLTGKHTRRKFGFSNFENDGSLHRINVPCFMFFNHHGLINSGLGYQLEVYDGRVIIRPRSYTFSVWFTKHTKEFLLT